MRHSNGHIAAETDRAQWAVIAFNKGALHLLVGHQSYKALRGFNNRLTDRLGIGLPIGYIQALALQEDELAVLLGELGHHPPKSDRVILRILEDPGYALPARIGI